MSDKIVTLPVWNRQASAAERLHELADMAEKNPEVFSKLFVGWAGERDGGYKTNYAIAGTENTLEVFGLLELLKNAVWRVVTGED